MADRVNGRPLHEGRCPESRGKESNLVSSITLPGLSIVLPRPTPVRKINVQGHRAMGIELKVWGALQEWRNASDSHSRPNPVVCDRPLTDSQASSLRRRRALLRRAA